MALRTYQCPHCFEPVKFDSDEGDTVECECRHCGNGFTCGEARRGRPDPVPDPELARLAAKVVALEARLATLEAWRAELAADGNAEAEAVADAYRHALRSHR